MRLQYIGANGEVSIKIDGEEKILKRYDDFNCSDDTARKLLEQKDNFKVYLPLQYLSSQDSDNRKIIRIKESIIIENPNVNKEIKKAKNKKR